MTDQKSIPFSLTNPPAENVLTSAVCERRLTENCYRSFKHLFHTNRFRTQIYGNPICDACYNHLLLNKSIGPLPARFNPEYFSSVTTGYQAYILGRIMIQNGVQGDRITLTFDRSQTFVLRLVHSLLGSNWVIQEKPTGKYTLTIKSGRISRNLKTYEKAVIPEFACDPDHILYWSYLRGCFEAAGHIEKGENPSCRLFHSSAQFLYELRHKKHIPPCTFTAQHLIWTEVNAMEFLFRLYNQTDLFDPSLKSQFDYWCNHRPSEPLLRFRRTDKDAVPPYKSRWTDSGFDLTLMRKIKEKNGVFYYDTCIQIQPQWGYYCDVVARSSLSKSGWMVANNVGIIDIGYTGSVIVALVRVVPDAKELELPARVVQLIPRPLLLPTAVEIEQVFFTNRNEQGGIVEAATERRDNLDSLIRKWRENEKQGRCITLEKQNEQEQTETE